MHIFLTLALVEDEWLEVSGQLHAPAALPPERAHGINFIGGCVDPRAGLDPTGTRTPALRSSSPQPVAIPTELSWLLR
jgi:hypothetical protein